MLIEGDISMITKTTKKPTCQCCEQFDQQYILQDAYTDRTPAYRVCANCLNFLVRHALSKKQFKNLLKNGHTANEFLLHEDFYDSSGNKLQPQE